MRWHGGLDPKRHLANDWLTNSFQRQNSQYGNLSFGGKGIVNLLLHYIKRRIYRVSNWFSHFANLPHARVHKRVSLSKILSLSLSLKPPTSHIYISHTKPTPSFWITLLTSLSWSNMSGEQSDPIIITVEPRFDILTYLFLSVLCR